MPANYATSLERIVELARLRGQRELAQALDDASYGATSGEIAMATRNALERFLRVDTERVGAERVDAELDQLAAEVVAAIDTVLPRS